MKTRTSVKSKLKHDDDNVYTSSSSSSSSSSSRFHLQTSFTETQIEELENQLGKLGYDGGMALIGKYGYERVKQAVDRALSRPQGMIRNLPGYIRYLVITSGKIPPPNGNKYTKGKYGHLVQT